MVNIYKVDYTDKLKEINKAITEILEKKSIEELKQSNNLKELKFITKIYEKSTEDTLKLFDKLSNDKTIDDKYKVDIFNDFNKTINRLKQHQEISRILDEKNKQLKNNFNKIINELTKDGFAGLNMAQDALKDVAEVSNFLDAGIVEISQTAEEMKKALNTTIHTIFTKIGEISKVQENIGLASNSVKNDFSEIVNNMDIDYKEKINELIEKEERNKQFEIDLDEVDPTTGKTLKEALKKRGKHWEEMGDILDIDRK